MTYLSISNIPRIDDIAAPLEGALKKIGHGGGCSTLLVVRQIPIRLDTYSNKIFQKLGKGLDQVHPILDTQAVDVILREAEKMFSTSIDAMGPKHAA